MPIAFLAVLALATPDFPVTAAEQAELLRLPPHQTAELADRFQELEAAEFELLELARSVSDWIGDYAEADWQVRSDELAPRHNYHIERVGAVHREQLRKLRLHYFARLNGSFPDRDVEVNAVRASGLARDLHQNGRLSKPPGALHCVVDPAIAPPRTRELIETVIPTYVRQAGTILDELDHLACSYLFDRFVARSELISAARRGDDLEDEIERFLAIEGSVYRLSYQLRELNSACYDRVAAQIAQESGPAEADRLLGDLEDALFDYLARDQALRTRLHEAATGGSDARALDRLWEEYRVKWVSTISRSRSRYVSVHGPEVRERDRRAATMAWFDRNRREQRDSEPESELEALIAEWKEYEARIAERLDAFTGDDR